MNKIIPTVVVTLILLAAHPAAQALALSDIQLNSSLNQTLDATIEILTATPQELDSLNASVNRLTNEATSNYKWPGVKVVLVRPEKGKSYLKITSKQSVREPILNFLLDLEWATGRVKREYSLLINPQF